MKQYENKISFYHQFKRKNTCTFSLFYLKPFQGIELLFRDNLFNYGIIIIVANWFPGIVASVHVIHMYRTEWPPRKTLKYAGLIIYQLFQYLISEKLCFKLNEFVFDFSVTYIHFRTGVHFVPNSTRCSPFVSFAQET